MADEDPGAASTTQTHGPIAKLRLLALWIQASPQRIQKWKSYNSPIMIHYDIDTRWNSTYYMIRDGIRSRQALMVLIR